MNDTNGNNAEIENAEAVAVELAEWWHASARDLPWRFGRATPWGVLVSEVMSQQTQMSRVVPYWNDWMERWPDAAALAGAAKSDVITAWGRLGYPRRALRLQECARVVASDYGNELPQTYDELLALPGIGDYTASAVMSFAFGERIAVVDTNIRRVLSRVFLGVESLGGAASPAERSSRCVFLRDGRPGLGERRTRPRQRFQGTDRQVRGLVLNALRNLPEGEIAVDRKSLERLWDDHIQLDRCIASLDEDGLIEILPNADVRLPV